MSCEVEWSSDNVVLNLVNQPSTKHVQYIDCYAIAPLCLVHSHSPGHSSARGMVHTVRSSNGTAQECLQWCSHLQGKKSDPCVITLLLLLLLL
jgi:hypothetical protein